jgi:hypothetical protein
MGEMEFLANFKYLAMSANLAKGQKGIGEKASSWRRGEECK